MNLTYTLLTDGSSDRTLLPIINWTLEQLPDIRFYSQHAEVSLKHSAGLLRRAAAAIEIYECDILLVHRDAENQAVDQRIEEIQNALAELNKPYVPIIPIRMTEAWLLIDEQAIRSAANNPNGTVKLNIPRADRLEYLPDPKNILLENLKLASGLPPGRLRKFRPESCRHRVAELICNFNELRKLSAFQQFEHDLTACIQRLRDGK